MLMGKGRAEDQMPENERQTKASIEATAAPGSSSSASASSEAGTKDRRGLNASWNQAAEGSPLTSLEELKIKCLNSALYHDDREKFLASWNRILMFIVVIFGASALTPARDRFPWIPALTAVAGLANLVFDINGAARIHSSLRQRLYSILADAAVNQDVASLEKQLILVYADEPPIMYAVNAVAYNNAMLSFDRPKQELMKIGLFARLVRHFWSYSANTFRTYAEIAAPTPH